MGRVVAPVFGSFSVSELSLSCFVEGGTLPGGLGSAAQRQETAT